MSTWSCCCLENKYLTKGLAMKHKNGLRLHPNRADFRDRYLLMTKPVWRMPTRKYWSDGIVLPFGASREAFTVPNFTFFDYTTGVCLEREFAIPIEGWGFDKISKHQTTLPFASRAPFGDIFGALHALVFHELVESAKSLRLVKQEFTIFMLCGDAGSLHISLPNLQGWPNKFDMIDVSNITDFATEGNYIGLRNTLHKVANPLLKQDGALISLFMNYRKQVDVARERKRYPPADEHTEAGEKVGRYFGKLVMRENHMDFAEIQMGMYRILGMANLFRDNNISWADYKRMTDMDASAKSAGMKINKVERPWEMDLNDSRDRKQVLDEIEKRRLEGISGHETFVVWIRS